jgi:hypothetical protein
MHTGFVCVLAGRKQQARLTDARRAFDDHEPARTRRPFPDSGAKELELRLALDQLLSSGDSHAAIVITASFRVKFRVLTL